MDENEKYWLDLVEKLKKEMRAVLLKTPYDSTALHNCIWEAMSEAFRRGQKQANGFHHGNPQN